MNKKVLVSGIILLVLVAGAGGFYFVKEQQKKNEEIKRQEQIRKEEEERKAEEERKKEEERIRLEEEKNSVRFPLLDNKYLQIKIPEGFEVETVKEGSVIVEYKFKNEKAAVSFSRVILTPEQLENINNDTFKAYFNKLFDASLKDVVEDKTLVMKDLKTDVLEGVYFMPLNDPQSENKGDDYKYLSQIQGKVENSVFLSVYFGRDNEATFDKWLEIVKSVKVVQKENANTLNSPYDKFSVKINKNSFKSDFEREGYLQGTDGDLVISVSLENKADSKDECKFGTSESGNGFGYDDEKDFVDGEFFAKEYTIKEYQGQVVNQRNIWRTAFRDGYCVDIHLSKMMFTEGDQKLFDDYLKNIEIVEK